MSHNVLFIYSMKHSKTLCSLYVPADGISNQLL